MATAGYGGGAPVPPDQTRALIAQTKTLLNQQLKNILQNENLKVSGVKSELQQRIISHIERIANNGDYVHLQHLRGLLYGHTHPDFSNNSSPSATYLNYTPPSSASPQYQPPMPAYAAPRAPMAPYNTYSRQLTFKNSPFYTIQKSLTSVIECRARESTRDTARANIDLRPEDAELLNKDANYRVMVFCSADVPASTPTEISFPHQVELKCNGNEVKANLRGLKGKPGSTRPADITSFIKKKMPGYQNILEMVYALTNKAQPALQKYFLVVNLVRKVPIENLVTELKQGKTISKERVVKESMFPNFFLCNICLLRVVTSKPEDTEIQATASVLSLKCTISARRIATPCRSISCAHNQCFDAASYLQLQEQAPQWICPLCNRSAPYSNLTIDLYVDSILKSTSASIEQVTIETDGSWHQQKQAETPRRSYNNPTPEEDDDLIEIRDDRISSLKAGARSSMPRGTPPMSSREPSSVPSASRSNKRPVSEVIDLTISDEEEEPPQKMIKRSSMSSLTNTDPYRVPSAPRFYFDMPSNPTYTNSDYADSPL